MSTVVSIVYTPEQVTARPAAHYARVPCESVELAAGVGIVGDRKSGGRHRHLNIMSAETLAQLGQEGFHTQPGEMGEQIILSGLAVDSLSPGTRLRLGAAAVVEVVEPRTGCGRFEQIQNRTASSAAGRLGVIARVLEGGSLRVGETVLVLPSE